MYTTALTKRQFCGSLAPQTQNAQVVPQEARRVSGGVRLSVNGSRYPRCSSRLTPTSLTPCAPVPEAWYRGVLNSWIINKDDILLLLLDFKLIHLHFISQSLARISKFPFFIRKWCDALSHALGIPPIIIQHDIDNL
jgi:hypothetical protein